MTTKECPTHLKRDLRRLRENLDMLYRLHLQRWYYRLYQGARLHSAHLCLLLIHYFLLCLHPTGVIHNNNLVHPEENCHDPIGSDATLRSILMVNILFFARLAPRVYSPYFLFLSTNGGLCHYVSHPGPTVGWLTHLYCYDNSEVGL